MQMKEFMWSPQKMEAETRHDLIIKLAMALAHLSSSRLVLIRDGKYSDWIHMINLSRSLLGTRRVSHEPVSLHVLMVFITIYPRNDRLMLMDGFL